MKRNLGISLLVVILMGCTQNAASDAGTGRSSSTPALSTRPPQSQTLTVFAAASLTEAFGEIGEKFQAANPNLTVMFNFAGSQTLQAQIEGGAPADVFVSANNTNMDALVSAGLIDQAAPQLLVTNSLVIVVPQSNPAQIESLRDLAQPGLMLVLADDTVPAGKYARQMLDNASRDPIYGDDFASKVLANIVSNEVDVKQVVAKVHLGEADAGIVYASDPMTAPDLKTITVPAGINIIAQYFIAPVRASAHLDLADEYIEYLLSNEGQAILQKWGFSPTH